MIRHLGLSDWRRQEFVDDELDALGPYSAQSLWRHGVLWPPNAYIHMPLLEEARGGALLTGVGGDNFLGAWRWARISYLLKLNVRPRLSDLRTVASAAVPARLRCAIGRQRRRRTPELPWLARAAVEPVAAASAEDNQGQPVRWNAWIEWHARRRNLASLRWSLDLLAEETGALVVHPLLDPRFVAALARAGGCRGFGDRLGVTWGIFQDLLPLEMILRQDKAYFDEVLWGRHARSFIEHWHGEGVDSELVDEAALRREWRKTLPLARSVMLLQSAWLASTGDRREEALRRAGQDVPAPGGAKLPGGQARKL
jgi:asparagine synthase (glutamine-hydrolysing)